VALGTGRIFAGAPNAHAATGDVTTLAGNRSSGFFDGTGGPTGTTRFNRPKSVALDATGNIYVTDRDNHRIRKITPDGTTTTLTGNGTAGFTDGTGGPTGTTQFNHPEGIAVDTAGNVYVGDSINHRIRKITPDGTTTTLTGNGTAGFTDGTGGTTGTTQFRFPFGVALDTAGNLYVTELNNRIRKITPDGTTTTLTGNGTAGFVDGTGGPTGTTQFNRPEGITVDTAGNVYVADRDNNRIRKITPNGTTTTLAGNGELGFADGTGGPTGTAKFKAPTGVAVDRSGNVYVADNDNNRIRKITPDGTTTTLAAQDPFAFSFSSGVALDTTGDVYVADSFNHRMRKIELRAPVVTSSATVLPVTATTMTIAGSGFETTPSNNLVTFNNGATGTVTAATATSLTVRFATPSTVGSLTAVVTNIGGNSGTAVQVALVAPVVTPNTTTNVIAPATSLTISGFGFSTTPASNTVTLSSGTGTVTTATATQLTLNVSDLTLGALTAVVTTNSQSSGTPVQIATITAPPTTTSSTTTTTTTTTAATTTTTTTNVPELTFPQISSGTPAPSANTSSGTAGGTTGTGTSGSAGGTPSGATTTSTTPANTAAPANTPSAATGAGTATTTTQPPAAPASASGTSADSTKQFDPAGVFTVNFAPGSATLSKTAKTTITNVAKSYLAQPAGSKIVISAHINQAANKTVRNLATKRANNVAKALKTALGKTATTNGLRITVDTKTDNPAKPTPAQTNRITIQTPK
jgi:outer membrane protein OmpA-like peptidoglycan-associated protein